VSGDHAGRKMTRRGQDHGRTDPEVEQRRAALRVAHTCEKTSSHVQEL
jgi:hypothetical protein